jgi:hypothetical protein
MDLINRKFIQEMNTVPLRVVDILNNFSLKALLLELRNTEPLI